MKKCKIGSEIAVNLRIDGIGEATVMLDDVAARAVRITAEGKEHIELNGKIVSAETDGTAKKIKIILWTFGLEPGRYRILGVPVGGVGERIDIDLEARCRVLEFELYSEPRLTDCEIGDIEASLGDE
ncbi:MAG TPA: hypothetical protein VMX35_05520 [Acidobacteriota bacterium]|nr:hypothetical protein [Acidobacteriota bacterium]